MQIIYNLINWLFNTNFTNKPISNIIIPKMEDNCPICFCKVKDFTGTSLVYCNDCKNVYHHGCYKEWMKPCPICRKKNLKEYKFISSRLFKLYYNCFYKVKKN